MCLFQFIFFFNFNTNQISNSYTIYLNIIYVRQCTQIANVFFLEIQQDLCVCVVCVFFVYYFLRLARATPATPAIPAAGTNNKAESGHKPIPVRGTSVPVT